MYSRRTMAYGVALAAALVSTTALSTSAAYAAPTTLVVSNPGPVSVPDFSPAGITSQITVTGQTGLVTDVDVTLNGFTSEFPDDLDVMLVGPNGRKVILMSDACGGDDLNNASVTFDDEALAPLSEGGPCGSGTFFPYNAEDVDEPPFVPTGPALSAFDGFVPNGVWTLVAADTQSGDFSRFDGGFTLRIQVSDVVAPIVKITKKPKPSTSTTQKVAFTADDPGSRFECKLDSGGWDTCKSPVRLKHLSVGKHKLYVRATDPSGNHGNPTTARLTVLPKPRS